MFDSRKEHTDKHIQEISKTMLYCCESEYRRAGQMQNRRTVHKIIEAQTPE